MRIPRTHPTSNPAIRARRLITHQKRRAGTIKETMRLGRLSHPSSFIFRQAPARLQLLDPVIFLTFPVSSLYRLRILATILL